MKIKGIRKNILGRLFLAYIATFLCVQLVMFAMVGAFVGNYFVKNKVDDIRKMTGDIERWTAAMHIDVVDTRAKAAFRRSLDTWSEYLNADIIIINNNSQITETTKRGIEIPEEYTSRVLRGETVTLTSKLNAQYPQKVVCVGVPLKYEGNQIGALFINAWMPRIRSEYTALIWVFGLFCLISVVASFIIVYIHSKKISRPILQINNAVRDIAAGNFTERVSIESPDEIGQLASSFNFMAESIEKSEAQKMAFISDVSHELRTPMTSISGFVEGILDGTIPPERQEKYLKIVLDESRRLSRLVNDLFEVSKMENSEYKLNISQFDINELIRICVIGLESKFCDKNLDLNIDFAKDELIAIGDKDCINRVVLNIVDNAIKFSYPNTTITISTWIEKRKIYVSVGNFGGGIDSSDLGNIFNRFYKTDKSRSKEKSGAGLGLALVKNIITMHKQNVWVECNDAKEGANVKYTKFTFTLEEA